MDRARAAAGFTGTFDAFVAFLRTDPRFYFGTAADLLAAYRDIAKRADPELARLFGRLPRTPYGVQPVPDAVAPSQTTAYYDAGLSGCRPARCHVRQHLQAGRQAEVGDGSPDAPRSSAGPPPPDLARAGAGGAARVPEAFELHGVRRRMGSVRRVARPGDGLLCRSVLASSASSPTRCGAPCAWSWIRAFTPWAGPASRPSSSSRPTRPRPNRTSSSRWTGTSCGPGRRSAIRWGRSGSRNSAAPPRRAWGRASRSAGFTTCCSARGRCRSMYLERRAGSWLEQTAAE